LNYGLGAGQVFPQQVEHDPGLEKQHTAVPEVLSALGVLAGLLQRRFLHEALHLAPLAVLPPGFYIAKSQCRALRWNSEHDDPPLACRLGG